MKPGLDYLKFVVTAGNAEVEVAAFQHVKDAEEFIERCGVYGSPSGSWGGYRILQRIDGRRVVGRTGHGDAILEAIT